AYSNGTGTRLNLSAAQIMAMKKQGGGKVWDEIVHWLDGAANSVGKFVGNLLNSGETGFQKGIQGKRGSGLTGKNLFKGYVPRTGSVQFAVGDGLVQFPTVGQSIHQSMYQ